MEDVLQTVSVTLTALLGVAAVVVGRKPVQRLREQTGDESALTGVLGGSAFTRRKAKREPK